MQPQRKGFCHLSQEQRVEIYLYVREGLSYREIGKKIGVSHTTISRELGRNSIDKGRDSFEYKPIVAQKRYKERRYKANHNHIILWKDDNMRKKIHELLKQKGTLRGPDEILGRLHKEGYRRINTSTLYRFIRHEYTEWQRYLRYKHKGYRTCKKGNKRKKHYTDVPNIGLRPEIVNSRMRIGDREGDTVVSNRSSKGSLVTLVERKTLYLLMSKVENQQAKTVKEEIEKMMQGEKFKTITFDNGSEFGDISKLKVQCYRANPYASYERGTNERTNGLIRWYIPKGADISSRTDEEIYEIQNNLNHKPRKKLGYLSPYEVYNTISLSYIS